MPTQTAYRSLAPQQVQASAQPAPDAPAVTLIDLTLLHPTHHRARMNQETINDYCEIMLDAGGWGPFPPAEAFFDGERHWLWRGNHRRAALNQAFMQSAFRISIAVPVIVRPGTEHDAKRAALSDNAEHGLPRSIEDKQRAVDWALADPELGQWSDARIAEECRVSAPFVGKRRRILVQSSDVAGSLGATVPAERTYVDRYGNTRTMDTSGIAASNKARAGSSVVASAATGSKQQGAPLAKCTVCGRPLSDPEHAAAGCGPVCAAKRAGNFVAAAPDQDEVATAAVVPEDWRVQALIERMCKEYDYNLWPVDEDWLIGQIISRGLRQNWLISEEFAAVQLDAVRAELIAAEERERRLSKARGLARQTELEHLNTSLPGVGAGLRSRFLALLDDLAEYVQITGDTHGAETLRRGTLAALAQLAAAGEE